MPATPERPAGGSRRRFGRVGDLLPRRGPRPPRGPTGEAIRRPGPPVPGRPPPRDPPPSAQGLHHPAAALHQPALRDALMADFAALALFLATPAPVKAEEAEQKPAEQITLFG